MNLDDGATLKMQKTNKKFKDAIESFNEVYVMMSDKMIEDSNNQGP